MSLDLMSKIVLDDFLRYIVGNAKNVSSGHAFIGSCKKTTFLNVIVVRVVVDVNDVAT